MPNWTPEEYEQWKQRAHRDRRVVSNPKPEHHPAPALAQVAGGKEKGDSRTRVRFTGYRINPLDPDNFAGSVKDLLDGLRHAGLLAGDESWRIILETDQKKVDHLFEERTVIEIFRP